MEYWQEVSASASIPPTSTSDVAGQNNKIEDIIFRAVLTKLRFFVLLSYLDFLMALLQEVSQQWVKNKCCDYQERMQKLCLLMQMVFFSQTKTDREKHLKCLGGQPSGSVRLRRMINNQTKSKVSYIIIKKCSCLCTCKFRIFNI